MYKLTMNIIYIIVQDIQQVNTRYTTCIYKINNMYIQDKQHVNTRYATCEYIEYTYTKKSYTYN